METSLQRHLEEKEVAGLGDAGSGRGSFIPHISVEHRSCLRHGLRSLGYINEPNQNPILVKLTF